MATKFSVAVNAAPNIFSPIKSTHRQASELETGLTGFGEDPELFKTDKQLKLSKHRTLKKDVLESYSHFK